MDAGAYRLKSELARVCLPTPEQDANRRLAWINSVCIFFLAVGVVGAQSHLQELRRPPPIEQPIPVVIEPMAPPPTAEVKQLEPQTDDLKEIAPRIVAVTLNTPAISFSVPTIGNLVVPMAAAAAPPPVELRQEAVVSKAPTPPSTTADTGAGGDRPKPDKYPELASQLGQQGTVVLALTVDDVGAMISVEVKQSSGFSLLDRDAKNWVKRHWIQPPIDGSHVFETKIIYELK